MKSETLIKIERNKQKYFASLNRQESAPPRVLVLEEPGYKNPSKSDSVKIAMLNVGKNVKHKIVNPISKHYQENHQKISKSIQQKTGRTRERVYSFLEVLFDA
jgi:hypothetical protein